MKGSNQCLWAELEERLDGSISESSASLPTSQQPISREFRSLSSLESAQKAMIFKGGISDRKEGPDILPSPSVSLGPPSDEIEPQQLKSRFSCDFSSTRHAKHKQPAQHTG